MNHSTKLNFEDMYDLYSGMLYSMALQISPTQKKAEQILIDVFTKAHQLNILEQAFPSLCLSLIKILIEVSHHHLNNNQGKTNFKLTQFEKSPVLHHMLCEQVSLESYCTENKITLEEVSSSLHEEFNLIRNKC